MRVSADLLSVCVCVCVCVYSMYITLPVNNTGSLLASGTIVDILTGSIGATTEMRTNTQTHTCIQSEQGQIYIKHQLLRSSKLSF